jgi:hypothetical protein
MVLAARCELNGGLKFMQRGRVVTLCNEHERKLIARKGSYGLTSICRAVYSRAARTSPRDIASAA